MPGWHDKCTKRSTSCCGSVKRQWLRRGKRVVVPARREAAPIVVVEDDAAVRRTLADALDSSGYRVRHAATGSEARLLVEQTKPDLIVLDLMLPDVDGLVLCSGLKHMASTPIVICSATPH